MLISEVVSSGSSVSLNVGKVASGEGIAVGDLILCLLNLAGLLGLFCVLLLDALQSCVVVIVLIWCGVGLLCLLVHVLCDLPLLFDLLEDLLEDLLLCLLSLGLLM